MGCDYKLACLDCKTSYHLGYGSYSTWMTHDTLAAFDADAAARPDVADRAKNQRLRRALVLHDGHEVSYVSADWTDVRAGVLRIMGAYGVMDPWILDWGIWTHHDMEAEDEAKWEAEKAAELAANPPVVKPLPENLQNLLDRWRERVHILPNATEPATGTGKPARNPVNRG